MVDDEGWRGNPKGTSDPGPSIGGSGGTADTGAPLTRMEIDGGLVQSLEFSQHVGPSPPLLPATIQASQPESDMALPLSS